MELNNFEFKTKEWLTPNSYNNNFSHPTNKPGIYLLVYTEIDFVDFGIKYEILYIGCSKNLAKRLGGHEILRCLEIFYDYIQIYFREEKNYKKIEKILISQVKPKFNRLGVNNG